MILDYPTVSNIYSPSDFSLMSSLAEVSIWAMGFLTLTIPVALSVYKSARKKYLRVEYTSQNKVNSLSASRSFSSSVISGKGRLVRGSMSPPDFDL